MESKETTGDVQGCLYKPICCRKKEDKEERLCIWHGKLKKNFRKRHGPMIILDILVITKEDITFLEESQKVIEQVFDLKVKMENDQSNLKIYSLLREYFKKSFYFLREKCIAWKNYLKKYKGIMKRHGKRIQKSFEQEILKEIKERDIDFNYNVLSGYLNPKTLFELLSVSNDNIGQLSFGKDPILTEETKEDVCEIFGEEIRSGIFECYYLIEGAYNKKESLKNSNLLNI